MLYRNWPEHRGIINADPNCANSRSSIALITRLFSEALKKPLNCQNQQLKNIYRDKEREKGIWGGGGVTRSSKGWRDTCTKHCFSLLNGPHNLLKGKDGEMDSTEARKMWEPEIERLQADYSVEACFVNALSVLSCSGWWKSTENIYGCQSNNTAILKCFITTLNLPLKC